MYNVLISIHIHIRYIIVLIYIELVAKLVDSSDTATNLIGIGSMLCFCRKRININ